MIAYCIHCLLLEILLSFKLLLFSLFICMFRPWPCQKTWTWRLNSSWSQHIQPPCSIWEAAAPDSDTQTKWLILLFGMNIIHIFCFKFLINSALCRSAVTSIFRSQWHPIVYQKFSWLSFRKTFKCRVIWNISPVSQVIVLNGHSFKRQFSLNLYPLLSLHGT